MTVVKIVEISASSPDGFEDAIRQGISRCTETLDSDRGAWVAAQKIVIEENEIVDYRVNLKVSFELD